MPEPPECYLMVLFVCYGTDTANMDADRAAGVLPQSKSWTTGLALGRGDGS